MSIDVAAPDGSSVSFPDGTPADVIKGAMAKHFGGGGSSPQENVPRETKPSLAEGTGRAFATGVPLVGGVLNKAEAATNALLAPLLDQYLPDNMEKLPEGSFSERYKHALDIQNRKDAEFAQEHPVVSTGAEIAGGLAGVGGALKAAPKAAGKVLGLDAATLPGQVVKGAAGGAGLTMADTALRGGDPTEGAEIGAITGAVAPVAGRVIGKGIEAIRGLKSPPKVPTNIAEVADVPVRQSLGQATGDTEAITREQMALRGADNSSEQAVARDFFGGQKQELDAARGAVASRMSPTGEVVAGSPQEAGEFLGSRIGDVGRANEMAAERSARVLANEQQGIRSRLSPTGSVIANTPTEAAGVVSHAVGNAEEAARASRDAAYEALRKTPGAFHPAAFNRVGEAIVADLNRGAEPIKVNPQTTPQAYQAVRDIDEVLGELPQQRDEAGRLIRKPPTTAAVVDDARKRLNSFYGDALSAARSSNNWSDVRAMRGVMRAFDDHVVDRLEKGTFIGGDANAVLDAMKTARGLHSEYRKNFTSQGAGDQVGQAVAKIVGKYEGQAATPEEIRSMLYGNGGLPVKIAQRLVNQFGADSPEIGAIKQGLMSHLIDAPTGGPLAPEKAADNIEKFLRSSTLSQVYLSSNERQALAAHAQRLRASAPAELSPVERDFAKIASGASATDVGNLLLSTKGGTRARDLVERVKAEFGEGSREHVAVKQGLWAKVTEDAANKPLDVGSRKIVKNIRDLLEGDGKPVADAAFSSEERGLMKAYADLLDRITPPPGTVNYSNTASVLGKMVRGTLDGIFGIGGMVHFGPLGAIAGTAMAMKGQAVVNDAIKAAKVTRLLYGTPGEAMAIARMQQSIARLASIGARGTTALQ